VKEVFMNDYNFVKMEPPHDKHLWVKTAVIIQDNKTKENVFYLDNSIYDEENQTASTWVWEDGNFACDCNRWLFFQRQKGLDVDFDFECSDGKYSVCIINPKTKEILYDEINTPIVQQRISEISADGQNIG
jgi:hypothetical protein